MTSSLAWFLAVYVAAWVVVIVGVPLTFLADRLDRREG